MRAAEDVLAAKRILGTLARTIDADLPAGKQPHQRRCDGHGSPDQRDRLDEGPRVGRNDAAHGQELPPLRRCRRSAKVLPAPPGNRTAHQRQHEARDARELVERGWFQGRAGAAERRKLCKRASHCGASPADEAAACRPNPVSSTMPTLAKTARHPAKTSPCRTVFQRGRAAASSPQQSTSAIQGAVCRAATAWMWPG